MGELESKSSGPLILTLTLDEASFTFFTALRKQYFPPERNYLDAHLTLFHHLSGSRPAIIQTIEATASAHHVLSLQVSDIVSIGNGVAYRVDNRELQSIHQYLQQQWAPMLTAQDRQRLRPHITIQNKVPAQVSRQLLQKLKADFAPFTFQGMGFTLWEYLGGPWKRLGSFPFRNDAGK